MARFLRLFPVLLFFLPVAGAAQQTYLPLGDEAYHLLDRMETRSGWLSNDLFLANKAVSRKDAYRYLSQFSNEGYYSIKTRVDNYHLFETLSENGEWEPLSGDGAALSQYSLGPFYKRRPDFVYVRKPKFFWVLNPVLGAQATFEQQPQERFLWNTAAGLATRGKLGRTLGFSLSLTHHNIQPVSYQQDHISRWEAIPGAGAFQTTSKGYQYFLFDGNLDVNLLKDHIYLDVGYGKHFLGDGIRSLFLSDAAGSNFYVGLNTKIWRLNYQNIYLRLAPNHFSGLPEEEGYKYAAIHYLSANIRPWLNVGLFESVVFSRNGGYEIAYMNPIIFYRAVERSLGSPDKITLGLNAKAIVARHLQFYGQFILNEFTASEFFKRNGYWANKWGAQLGAKYFDAFGVPNLDLQAELNMVRPYTYTHSTPEHSNLASENYSTWNQPLAHPLGADFQEVLGIIRYQPAPKWSVEARGMLYRQSVDSGGANFGNNIFKDYSHKDKVFGVYFINGPEAVCMMLNLNAAYEWKPNLFFFAGGTYRDYDVADDVRPSQTGLFFSAGFRLNLNRQAANWY